MATIRSIRLFDGQIQLRILACNLPAKHIFHLFHCEHLISYPIISHAVSTGMENYFIKNQITNRSICTAGSTCCKHSFPEYESIYFAFQQAHAVALTSAITSFLRNDLIVRVDFNPISHALPLSVQYSQEPKRHYTNLRSTFDHRHHQPHDTTSDMLSAF